jgi:putative inorganic carbon (HCO3(-)) transporter
LLIILSVAFSSLFFPALKGLSKYVIYLSSYVVFFNILKDKPKRAFYIVGIVVVTVFIEALIAIHQNFIGVEELAGWQDTSNVNPEQIMTRVFGTLQPLNPNLFGGYLVAGFPCVIGTFFLSVIRKMPRLSIISLFAVCATLLAIVFTGSRGAYLGSVAILAAVMAISGHIIWHNFGDKAWLKRIWTYLIIIGVLGAIAVIITSPALQHRILSIFAFREDSSNSFRMNVYISSFNMFLDNWLIGIGPGNEVFRLIYGHYMITAFDALSAYNIFLETAIECGIFGLFAFLWLIAAIFLKGAKVVMSDENIEKKILICCCVVGVLGMMVHGMVDTVFFRPQLQVIFWMYVAILGTYLSKTE